MVCHLLCRCHEDSLGKAPVDGSACSLYGVLPRALSISGNSAGRWASSAGPLLGLIQLCFFGLVYGVVSLRFIRSHSLY